MNTLSAPNFQIPNSPAGWRVAAATAPSVRVAQLAGAGSPARESGADAAWKTDLRPKVDWWEVNGHRFNSTADLVAATEKTPAGVQATYHYADKEGCTPSDLRHAAINGAITGAVCGTLLVGAGALALSFMGEISSILMPGIFSASGTSSVLLPLAAGVVGGGVIGARQGRHEAQALASQGHTLAGTVARLGSVPTFFPQGKLEQGVDLTKFATASPVPTAPAVPAEPAWKDALKGAALGAATPVSSYIPLVGLVGPAAVCSTAGAALSPVGASVGGAVGLGITVASMAALHAGSVPAMGALVGAGALLGAALGPKVLAQVRQKAAEDQVTQGQWWREATHKLELG